MGALGRVDCPPMSRMLAPEVRCEERRAVRAVGEVGLRPPSEKESGVRLIMDIVRVVREGRRGVNAVEVALRGVRVVGGRVVEGRAWRCCCIVELVGDMGVMWLGISLGLGQ